MQLFCRLSSRGVCFSTLRERRHTKFRINPAWIIAQIWLAMALVAVPSHAQVTTGSITGTISDPTQAVIPNAQVTASNESTGVVSSTKSDASGHYEFLSLPVGSYTLTVVQQGFDTSKISGVTLRLYQQLTQNIVLKLGAAEANRHCAGDPDVGRYCECQPWNGRRRAGYPEHASEPPGGRLACAAGSRHGEHNGNLAGDGSSQWIRI